MRAAHKLYIFGSLFLAYVLYTYFVYTSGTEGLVANSKAVEGKYIFQQRNCIACHQLYGLGGYLGPELTTVISQREQAAPGTGEQYERAILKIGTARMPEFHFKESEIDALIEFLKYVDSTAIPIKSKMRLIPKK
jgi:nitric oxide reductase subunit C